MNSSKSSVLCIDCSYSLFFVCVTNSSTVQYFVLTIVSLCVLWHSSTVQYFVLTIVSLCVCYDSSTVHCFVLTIVSLCVCYEQFNSLVLCIDYSFSLTVQQFGVLYWLLFICVCVMNSSTFRCFVLTIVSLCVLWTVQQFSALYWL